jgi:CysZ protein
MLYWILASFAQLNDRRFLKVLALSGLSALAAFAVVFFALDWLIGTVDVTGWPGWLANSWSFADGWIVGLVTVGLSFFLFTGVATAIMGLFLDSIVDAVEGKHYRGWRAPRSFTLKDSLRMGLRSGLRLIGWNLALVPVYIMMMFTFIGPLLLFLGVNGWLFGRDLMEMVLMRHKTTAEARQLIKGHSGLAFGIGVTASALLLMPFFGIVGPLIGAAVATHAAHWLMAHTATPVHSART